MNRRACPLPSFCVVATVLLTGCSSYVDSNYGRRGGTSVNGTDVLGQMFKRAGHDVRWWNVLSPSLQEADVVVWAPDDYDLPPARSREWLDDWLRYNYEEKVLIYIGRDHDALPSYWEFAQQGAPPEQQGEATRRLRNARRWAAERRNQPIETTDWDEWFHLDPSATAVQVKSLTGPWSEGIDPAQLDLQRYGRLSHDEDADVLLATGEDQPLVSELTFSWAEEGDWADSSAPPARLIIVDSGAFLLNMPLVNHECRKLAGKLVDHVGSPRKRVVFLQSRRGGPPVRDSDPQAGATSGLAMFGVWPIGGVLVHVATLGFLYALARWPIFGVPRRLERESLTDFGAHVRALGRLMEKNADVQYAKDQLNAYRHTVLGETDSQRP